MCTPWLVMTMLRTVGTAKDGVPVLLAVILLQMAKLCSRLEDMLNNALVLSTSHEGQNCTKSLIFR